MKYIHIYIVLLVVLFASCKSSKVITTDTTSKDSSDVRIEYRYIEILTPDTQYIEIPIETHEAIEEDSSILSTLYAVSSAYLRSDGRLYHSIKNTVDSLPIEVQTKTIKVYKDTTIYKYEYKDKYIEAPIKQTSKFATFCKWFFFFVIAVGLVFLYFKLKL